MFTYRHGLLAQKAEDCAHQLFGIMPTLENFNHFSVMTIRIV